MSDITLKVKVKYSDGEWIASTPVYDITGTGKTPEIALGNFTSALEELYSGDKFLTANNRPVEISHMITGVSADVYLTVKMDRPLSDFGIEVAEEPELQPALEGQEILALPPAKGDPIAEDDTEEETPSSAPTVTTPITCRTCQSFHEARRGLGRNWCDTTMLDAQGDDAACEQYEAELVTDMANRIRAGDPVFGLSMKRDATNRLGTTSEEWILLPANTTHTPQPGTRVFVYETGKTKAFVGKFIAGESKQLERDAAITDEWLFKLHATSDDIAARYGTAFRATAVEVCNYREFFLPIPVPADEKVPRGLTWLPPRYLLKMFPEASGK